MIALGLAALTLALWIVGGGEVALGSRRITFLRDVEPPRGPTPPRVSVVVAARNEEAGVRSGLRSVLAQRGLDFDVVAVDDRSEDATGTILDELAAADPRLRVVHLSALPDDWLGKTHALHVGAASVTGDWLLFTDADVLLAPSAVARAVAYASARGLDHLAVTPELRMPTLGADLFGGTFILLFSRYARPWKARDPDSRSHVGVGAFNLVRRAAYGAIDGHSRLRLCPDDDMMLGKALKLAGFRQDVAFGTGMVAVEWYSSLGESIRGLEKNAFAGLRYSLALVVGTCLAMLVFAAWPWAAIFLTEGAARLLNAGSIAMMVGLYVASARASGARPWLAIAIPAAICVFCYTILRAAMLALRRGAVRWRGTSYPLERLRRGRF